MEAAVTESVDQLPPRVLVVDDDGPLREALVELLQQKGFVVVGQASNGPDAVTMAQANEPDVVLIDFRMPGMDGLEATSLIKAWSPATQAVMFTAYEDPTLSLEATQTDVYCLIVKGCRPELLLDMLRRAADLKRELESKV